VDYFMNIKDKVELEQEIIKTTWKCGIFIGYCRKRMLADARGPESKTEVVCSFQSHSK
jgi:hypothetical protein